MMKHIYNCIGKADVLKAELVYVLVHDKKKLHMQLHVGLCHLL